MKEAFPSLKVSHILPFNALTAVGALMTLIYFTLSNARRFYWSMGNPLAMKGLKTELRIYTCSI